MANTIPTKSNWKNAIIMDIKKDIEEEKSDVLEPTTNKLEEVSEEIVEEEEEVELTEPPKDEDIFNVNQPKNLIPVNTEEKKKKKKKQLSQKQKDHLAKIRVLAAQKRKAKAEAKKKAKEEKRLAREKKKAEKEAKSKAWREKRGLPKTGKVYNLNIKKKTQPIDTPNSKDLESIKKQQYQLAFNDFMTYMDRRDKIKREKKQNIVYKQQKKQQIRQPSQPIRTNRWQGQLW
tara:strand:+ start:672 stop:1367 length:696 start_codon:yes stop_codon:yes gene_type:complete